VRVGSAGQLGIHLLLRRRPLAGADDEPVFARPFGVLGDRREVQRAGQARLLALFSDERSGSPLAKRRASSGPFRDAMTNASSEG
jgi:hypothetical protein